MKNFTLVLVICCLKFGGFAQKYEALKIIPATVKPNNKIAFTYNSALTILNNKKNISIAIYAFTKSTWVVIEPKTKQANKEISGNFAIPDETQVIALVARSGSAIDNNKNKGYVIPVAFENNKPPKEYYQNMMGLYWALGSHTNTLESNLDSAYKYVLTSLDAYPESYEDAGVMGNLFFYNKRKFSEDWKEKNLQLLSTFKKKEVLNYSDLELIIEQSKLLNLDEEVIKYSKISETNFPKEAQRVTDEKAFFDEKEPNKKGQLLNSYKTNYPTALNDNNLAYWTSHVIYAFTSSGNLDKATEWASKLKSSDAAELFNNLSWSWAEAGINLEKAKMMSYKAVKFAEEQLKLPMSEKPIDISQADWYYSRRSNIAMYADTYSFINYQLGDHATAYKYALKAIKIKGFVNASYNERYVMAMEKTQSPKVTLATIEKMIITGKATEKMLELTRELYTRQKKSDAGFEEYLKTLQTSSKMQKKKELAASMISLQAPNFSLKDTDGKEVSLESVKGKIVIVDFWATWCRPCIESMPGLKLAVERHKNNESVQFLFVDTWEQGDDKAKKATEFMQQKNYPFHVLMDDNNKMVTDYKVSGIPTKFIIDQNGNIRFKVVGFDGSTTALAEEIELMIELLSNS